MLYSIEGKKMTKVPHYKKYLSYVKQMNKSDLDQISAYLNSILESEEVFNSSYIPPKHWKGSVFQPIYDMIRDKQLSAFFYGQILWKTVMEDDKKWMFQQADNTLGKVYFLVESSDILKD
ncbi:hypothetical protein I0292_26540 (plasmid) [Priestia megaterium]|uniref:hypothetical protein n=1 Tax=Priestia megaterium TaxID=1404 RepID=UPI0020558D68|nr:hypothetical protein [Priestia megaterium]UOO43808.1 hypothetical protein I0292_26540 [Priestia megaterium]